MAPSVAELARIIGRKGLASIGEVKIPVEVKDVRERYGKIDLLVTPTSGSGEQWVHRDNVELDAEPDQDVS